MLQLTILAGKTAPATVRLRGTSACIGRGPAHDICMDDDGVWEKHLRIMLEPNLQFLARCRPETHMVINGQTVNESPLRNGDIIELGAAKLRFGFAETNLRRHATREAATWMLIVLVLLLQIGLIYSVSRIFD